MVSVDAVITNLRSIINASIQLHKFHPFNHLFTDNLIFNTYINDRRGSTLLGTSFQSRVLRSNVWILHVGMSWAISIELPWGFICTFSLSISLSITLRTSKFTSSSRFNWTGISTVNSNGSWNDKHSCHFSTAKEISAKAAFFFM